jgi:hypothetical protein
MLIRLAASVWRTRTVTRYDSYRARIRSASPAGRSMHACKTRAQLCRLSVHRTNVMRMWTMVRPRRRAGTYSDTLTSILPLVECLRYQRLLADRHLLANPSVYVYCPNMLCNRLLRVDGREAMSNLQKTYKFIYEFIQTTKCSSVCAEQCGVTRADRRHIGQSDVRTRASIWAS